MFVAADVYPDSKHIVQLYNFVDLQWLYCFSSHIPRFEATAQCKKNLFEFTYYTEEKFWANLYCNIDVLESAQLL